MDEVEAPVIGVLVAGLAFLPAHLKQADVPAWQVLQGIMKKSNGFFKNHDDVTFRFLLFSVSALGCVPASPPGLLRSALRSALL